MLEETYGPIIMPELPEELLLYVFQFLPGQEQITLESTSQIFRRVLERHAQDSCKIKGKSLREGRSWLLSSSLKTIYSCDRNRGYIFRGEWLENAASMHMELLLSQLNAPKGVTVHDGVLYWSENNLIARCPLDRLDSR